MPTVTAAPDSDILTIAVGGPLDADGARLRALLDCQFAYERARGVWQRWLWLFGAATCASWLLWPRLLWMLPLAVRGAALPAWLLVSARAALAGVAAWYRGRRWDAALAAHPAADVRPPRR